MTQRIIIFGGDGQVGHAFRAASFPKDWEVTFLTRKECDLTDPASLRKSIQSAKPTLVINAAAMTNVDACEKDEPLAHKVNFHAVAQMAAQCSTLDIPLIHISTDYVFDGNTKKPYQENDPMNPINYYGASKMMGEEAIRHELPWHVILRVSSVFSAYQNNIMTKAIEFIEKHDELRFVTDILSAPTPAPAIAESIIEIAKQLFNGKVDGFGTFHLCGTPNCSRYDFTKEVMKAYTPYTTRRPTIDPAVRADFPTPAQRPAYSLLDCAKIERVYGIKQPKWQEDLKEAISQLYDKKETS